MMCVWHNDFLRFLKETTFQGLTGNISFDEKGDVLGSYEILNLVGLHHDRSVAIPVGRFQQFLYPLHSSLKKYYNRCLPFEQHTIDAMAFN